MDGPLDHMQAFIMSALHTDKMSFLANLAQLDPKPSNKKWSSDTE